MMNWNVTQNTCQMPKIILAKPFDVMNDMKKGTSENKCEFIDFTNVPLEIKKWSKTWVCSYEMQKPKWKGVVIIMGWGCAVEETPLGAKAYQNYINLMEIKLLIGLGHVLQRRAVGINSMIFIC